MLKNAHKYVLVSGPVKNYDILGLFAFRYDKIPVFFFFCNID